MSKISRRRLAQTAVRLLSQRPADRARIVQGVAAYLLEHKQAQQLGLLMKDIARELELTQSIVAAEVTSAHALDAAARKNLTAYLQQATKANAVELTEQVDSSLLSGVVVRTADRELDTTTRRALQQLASLTSGRN